MVACNLVFDGVGAMDFPRYEFRDDLLSQTGPLGSGGKGAAIVVDYGMDCCAGAQSCHCSSARTS